MMQNLLKDAAQLQRMYLMLLSNESAAATWMSRVLDSVITVINEVTTRVIGDTRITHVC